MYAVIATGGKQYRVSVGDVLEVEKLEGAAGDKVELPVIMTVDGETVTAGAKVAVKATAGILAQGKDKKLTIFKYKPKKNVRKKQGHRQYFTRIKIEKLA
ncbi:MAG: 50S ribosomal protein L21 [Clostridiales bacterium]|jgi:large subunit ribosomal protein L21|nr:50S ribosomal protein L21 [Clostridiales bacterium]